MKQKSAIRNGFSFIELLIAFVLTFSLIIGTAELILQTIWIKKRSDHRLNAATILTSQLEGLKSEFFSGSEWQEESCLTAITGQAGNQKFIIEWTFQPSAAGLNTIEMKCYPESSPFRETRLVLFLSDELGF